MLKTRSDSFCISGAKIIRNDWKVKDDRRAAHMPEFSHQFANRLALFILGMQGSNEAKDQTKAKDFTSEKIHRSPMVDRHCSKPSSSPRNQVRSVIDSRLACDEVLKIASNSAFCSWIQCSAAVISSHRKLVAWLCLRGVSSYVNNLNRDKGPTNEVNIISFGFNSRYRPVANLSSLDASPSHWGNHTRKRISSAFYFINVDPV